MSKAESEPKEHIVQVSSPPTRVWPYNRPTRGPYPEADFGVLQTPIIRDRPAASPQK